MQIDKDLLQYCKDKEFPIEEMITEDFKRAENILDYQFYKLGLILKDLINELGLEKMISSLINKLEK